MLPVVEVLFLQNTSSPRGACGAGGEFVRFPIWGFAGHPLPTCPQSSAAAASKFKQHDSFQQLASHFFPDRVIPGGFKWEERKKKAIHVK